MRRYHPAGTTAISPWASPGAAASTTAARLTTTAAPSLPPQIAHHGTGRAKRKPSRRSTRSGVSADPPLSTAAVTNVVKTANCAARFASQTPTYGDPSAASPSTSPTARSPDWRATSRRRIASRAFMPAPPPIP